MCLLVEQGAISRQSPSKMLSHLEAGESLCLLTSIRLHHSCLHVIMQLVLDRIGLLLGQN